LRSFDSLAPHPKVTFLIDESRSGKSTLMETIAVSMGFNPEGETKILIAAHSPILMAYPDASIYQFDTNGMSQVAYEEIEHYQVSSFLMNPERMLRNLLRSE
jgi:predicted ATPase